jgi:hypothetical protein
MRPRLAHHTLAVQLEHVEGEEGEVTTNPVPLGEYGLDALVSVTGHRLAVEDGRRDGPSPEATPCRYAARARAQAG